jgi:RNA-directed DNA polymerase
VNIYMHEFDMFVKQELRVKYYVRYADDFVFLSGDRECLEELLPKIDDFLRKKLQLTLHEHKVYIKNFDTGVDFLGWVHFPHHRVLRTATKRRVMQGMKGYPRKETVISYAGLLSHGNTHKLQKRLRIR